jgi:hypothetical protein
VFAGYATGRVSEYSTRKKEIQNEEDETKKTNFVTGSKV